MFWRKSSAAGGTGTTFAARTANEIGVVTGGAMVASLPTMGINQPELIDSLPTNLTIQEVIAIQQGINSDSDQLTNAQDTRSLAAA